MKKNIMPTLVLVCICVVAAALLAGINMITGPIIEAQKNASANAALLEVLPNGKNFVELEITAEYPSCVKAGYKADGGFVFQMEVAGYQPGLVIMCGIDTDGKVVGVKHLQTNETYGLETELNGVYIDKTLDSVELILATGATPKSNTSKAYFTAIQAALQANATAAGVKIDPVIVLESKMGDFAPMFANPTMTTLPEGSVFVKAFKASNDSGFAYIYSDGETGYLIFVNAMGVAVAYNENGEDVTASQSALVEEAKTHAAANQKSYFESLSKKITGKKFFPDAVEITEIQVDTFASIVSAASFKVGDAVYYAYYSRTIGFHQMDVFVFIDAEGKIAKTDIKEFLFEADYYDDAPDVNLSEYKGGFEGITDTWTGDQAMIAGATLSSKAVKESINDAFAAFKLITQEGGAQ